MSYCYQLDFEGTGRRGQRRGFTQNQGCYCVVHTDHGCKHITFHLLEEFVLIVLQGWGYSVTILDNFLLKLFEKYAELLKRRFSDDFQEVRGVSIGVE